MKIEDYDVGQIFEVLVSNVRQSMKRKKTL